MRISLTITVQSHLSDALIEVQINPALAQHRIRFVKWLISKYNGNLTTKVDIDEEYKEFKEQD